MNGSVKLGLAILLADARKAREELDKVLAGVEVAPPEHDDELELLKRQLAIARELYDLTEEALRLYLSKKEPPA